MGLGKGFRNILYTGGAIMVVVSILIIARTIITVVPAIGLQASAMYLGMSVFFLLVGIGIVILARWDGKKEAAKEAAARAASEEQP